jgi:hypothetical protein
MYLSNNTFMANKATKSKLQLQICICMKKGKAITVTGRGGP